MDCTLFPPHPGPSLGEREKNSQRGDRANASNWPRHGTCGSLSPHERVTVMWKSVCHVTTVSSMQRLE